jgi:hypothetical protein
VPAGSPEAVLVVLTAGDVQVNVYDPAGFGVTVAEPLLEPQVGFVFVLVKENVDETLHAPLHEFIVPATFLTQVALPSVCLDDENPLPGACPIYSANPIPKFAGPDKEEKPSKPIIYSFKGP